MNALILDCDGVLAETERDLHLPAFNQAFKELGLPVCWSAEQYAGKLLVAGGKERIATSLGPELMNRLAGGRAEDDRDRLVEQLHARKTEIVAELLASRPLQARPGVRRLITEAHDAGWKLAIASTSAEATVRLIAAAVLGARLAETLVILAGDVVSTKKPDPEIYELAVAALGVSEADTIAIEDSRNGLLAATAAGLTCVITESEYSRGEDFSEAALVLSSLGDPNTPMEVFANRTDTKLRGYLTVADLNVIRRGARLQDWSARVS